MRRPGRGWSRFSVGATLLLLALAASQAVPAAASARPRHKRDEPYLLPEFEIPASNGYRALVFWIEGRRKGPDKVGVFAWNSTSSTTYVGPGQVSEDHVRAGLGPYGKVDVSFERHGVRRVTSLCGRGPQLYVDGVFRGVVEFEGDEGFTASIDPQLEAEPLFRDPWECSGSSGTVGGGPGSYLKVYSRYGETVVVQNVPGGPVRYEAFAEGKRGQIEIGRAVEVMGPASGFHWSENLKRAEVTPPPPFWGTATYRSLGGKITHWEGNLHVDFAGYADYPLNSGPSFTEFIHGNCHVFFPPSDEPHPPSTCM